MTQTDHSKLEPTSAAREPFRWRRLLQYKLRTLLFVVIPLCAAFFAWWSYRAHQQRTAVAMIRNAGGRVAYDFEVRKLKEPSYWPKWLVDAIGVDYFANVQVVDVSETPVTNAALEHLKALTKLEALDLVNTQITDAGLEHLNGLTTLQELLLGGTKVTDGGLEHLKALTKLEALDLGSTQITDPGLNKLKELTALRHLDLRGTQVTDAGLEKIQRLTNLQILCLDEFKVSEAAVARLKRALPKCNIYTDYLPH